ncbi:MAG: biotin-dependent carboxyltransferase family protein [Verrucomicrobiales bacterium]|nr:biotin-dependent carboxyltransferase family protein [Verrucomicrobiales bacterium]
MNDPVLELISPGLGASLQDHGRRGWKRFGVPPGGALDDHAACWANLLVGNPLHTPVLELLLHGAVLRVLRPLTVSITGAALIPDAEGLWRTFDLEEDDEVAVPPPESGVWTYLAVRGGFLASRWFGSVSVFPRGGLGSALTARSLLHQAPHAPPHSPPHIGRRWVDPTEQRNYAHPPALRVWPGPQWDLFPEAARDRFFSQPWRISSRSDRTGYRLDGNPLSVSSVPLPSEPVLPGSIQLPPDGVPIVTQRDGPTVGGYPKIGVVDPADLSWLVQCRPGQEIRFIPATCPPLPATRPS